MIKISHLKFKYNEKDHFKIEINTNIKHNSFNVLLGPSGSGKTTFIGLISGFLTPSIGDIYINEQSILILKPYERDISIMFQNNNVFLHLSVIKNLELVFKKKNLFDLEKIDILLHNLGIYDYKHHKAYELSNGQIQRLALAMRLIQNKKILLMDEPFSALDPTIKDEMMKIVYDFWLKYQLTIIMVSHDYNSVRKYVQNIIFMNKGEIIFNDTKEKFNSSNNTEIKNYLHHLL